MKIAVLIYGRLTNATKHYENIINTIGKENTVNYFLSSDNSPEESLTEFINIYNPISYTNEKITYEYDFKKYPIPPYTCTNVNNMICHFINKQRVFQLLENHIKKCSIIYDIILSLRIDLVFENNFNFDNLEKNTIYIPKENDWVPNAINDQVAYGQFDVMKKYNMIFSNLIYLLENGCYLHPETLTLRNINFHGINIERVNIKHFIER